MFKIGVHKFKSGVFLAPMSGITDKPFRSICQKFGAELAPMEMVIGDAKLWQSKKTLSRLNFDQHNNNIKVIQLVGHDENLMSEAAYQAQEMGANIIDINLGCPAKKVCGNYAGSALLAFPTKIKKIFEAIQNKISIPLTVKIRTGSTREENNALDVLKIAEDYGLSAMTIHGRSRECKFKGSAEYDTIRKVKQEAKIPIIANGDIDSQEKARKVKEFTGADGIMIGRAALGNPWIFSEISFNGTKVDKNSNAIYANIRSHIKGIYALYGKDRGVKISRKHLCWYIDNGYLSPHKKLSLLSTECHKKQLELINH